MVAGIRTPTHGNSPFRGRATPAFALTLPVPWTSPLRRKRASVPAARRDRFRPKVSGAASGHAGVVKMSDDSEVAL